MLTSRDFEVIDFIKQFKVASTPTIAKTFFPSLSACQKRLKILYGEKKLQRARDSLNDHYIYFVRQPKQLRHSLHVTDFYGKLLDCCSVLKFNIEPAYGDIRPDGAFVYQHNGKNYVGLLEVELSNKGFDYYKYERFFSSGDYKKYMTAIPTVFIMGDHVKDRSTSYIKVIIRSDLSNLRVV